MTKEMMNYYFEEAKYLSKEEFQQNMISATDSYEQCMEKLRKVTCCFSSGDYRAWAYYKAIYNDIPKYYRIPLMLEVIYESYPMDYLEMLHIIDTYVKDETEEEKQYRILRNKAMLKNRVRKDGNVKVYRGIAEGYLMPDYAISYTLDKKVAQHIVDYHKARHGSRFGVCMEDMIAVEDILFYSNRRKEREVFVIPSSLKEWGAPDNWDEISSLDEGEMDSSFWWAEDMKVIEALYDEEHMEEMN